jgi:serine/threonine protein kinase
MIIDVVRSFPSFHVQLQAGPPLDEMSIACILRDLLHAIEYLHSEGKIHRDIKGFTPPPFPFLIQMFLVNVRDYLEQLLT